MVSHEQAVVSSTLVTLVTGYFLWTLIHTEGFSPYILAGTPDIGNIFLFIVLISIVFSGILTISTAIALTLYSKFRQQQNKFDGATIGVTNLVLFFMIFIMLLLHVFHIVNILITLLSYILFWGIVIYGRIKDKKKLEKYIAKSSGGAIK